MFAAMLLLPAAAGCNLSPDQDKVFVIGESAGFDGLHAPWDGLDDGTVFRCFTDSVNLYFVYEVEDSTVTLTENFTGERDVEPEDRVEIFFSPDSGMARYYCAEIDPIGRIMDYSAEYYAKLDYNWDFSSLHTVSKLTEDGYVVAGKISLSELEGLGIDLYNGFHMGVFRADFRTDGSVTWFSYVETDDPAPDFHRPKMLFPAKIK